ncbi:MAG: hypothetical protein AAGJ57_01085, partial [Pseudomonadota bacterium]
TGAGAAQRFSIGIVIVAGLAICSNFFGSNIVAKTPFDLPTFYVNDTGKSPFRWQKREQQ